MTDPRSVAASSTRDADSAPSPGGAAPAGAGSQRRALGLTAAVAALVAVGGWGALRLASGGPATAPAVEYGLIDGRRLGPEALAGRPLLVNFWATTCAVCVEEMPQLAAIYEAYRVRGLELIAVAMPYDRADRVLRFAAARALPFPVALDPMGRAVAAWGGVQGTPTTWLVGPDGRVLRRWVGRPDFARLRRDLEGLLPSRGG
jgi:thiol-disulfide isomerase/thioredoxin